MQEYPLPKVEEILRDIDAELAQVNARRQELHFMRSAFEYVKDALLPRRKDDDR